MMHGKLGDEVDDGEGEEGVSGFFAVGGDDAVVAAQVAGGETGDFELELLNQSRPSTSIESRAVSSITTEKLV